MLSANCRGLLTFPNFMRILGVYAWLSWLMFINMGFCLGFMVTQRIHVWYSIFTYIYHRNHPNVGKYTIHGSCGLGFP